MQMATSKVENSAQVLSR